MRMAQIGRGHAPEQALARRPAGSCPAPVRCGWRRGRCACRRPSLGSPQTTLSTTLAVLRPTPGRASSASRLRGTRPPCCSTRMPQVSIRLPGLAAEQADGLDVLDQAGLAELQHARRAGCDGEQPARRLVDADIGGLRRQQHGGQALEGAGEHQLGSRFRVGGLQGGEEGLDGGGLHAHYFALARARASAASTAARLSGGCTGSARCCCSRASRARRSWRAW